MPSPLKRSILAAIGAAVAVGCSLLTPLDVFDPLPDAAPRDDANVSDVDNPSEASPGDGGTNGDASDGAALDGSWCVATGASQSSTRIFCDDFDDLDAALYARWSAGQSTTAGGTLDATADALSPPRALMVNMPAIPGTPQFGTALLTTDLDASVATTMSLRFALHVTQADTNSGFNSIAQILFEDSVCATRDSGNKERRAALVMTGEQLNLSAVGLSGVCVDAGQDDSKSFFAIAAPKPEDGWVELELRASKVPCPSSSGHSLRLVQAGTEVKCATIALDPTTLTKGLQIRIGSSVGAPQDPGQIEFDNVDVRVE